MIEPNELVWAYPEIGGGLYSTQRYILDNAF